MTVEELLHRLNGVEWNDFEAKRSQNRCAKERMGNSQCVFQLLRRLDCFGIKERKAGGVSTFEIQGVDNAEKVEQDFIGVLRSNGKFNQRISVQPAKYEIDGKIVLAFCIPMAEFKPIYIGVPTNTYIRVGSGDQRATEYEIRAMIRDQSFWQKSNEAVFGSSYADIKPNIISGL